MVNNRCQDTRVCQLLLWATLMEEVGVSSLYENLELRESLAASVLQLDGHTFSVGLVSSLFVALLVTQSPLSCYLFRLPPVVNRQSKLLLNTS